MFRLSDSTRRKISLGLFFAFCVVPTAIVLTLVAWHNRPGHVQAEADRLARLLGQRVTLEGVEHPLPNVIVYHQLTVSDPESGKLLFHCGRLKASPKHTQNQEGGEEPCLMLVASDAKADAGKLDQLRRLVNRILSHGTAWSGIDLTIAVRGELALITAADPTTCGSPLALTDVGCHLVTNAEGALAEICFRQGKPKMPDLVWISAQRNRLTNPPETLLRVNTGESYLPTYLLSLGWKQFEHLGPDCRFRGVIDSQQTAAGSSGNLAGDFQDLDLDSLVSDRFDHRLNGTAQLVVETARFSQGRLVDASGRLMSGPGLVSRSLLDAAQQSLGMPRGGASYPGVDPIPFDRLAVSFAINSAALEMRDAIMTDSHGPLLGPSVISSRPIASVIEALCPTERAEVSATRQTARLMSRLPLPDGRQRIGR